MPLNELHVAKELAFKSTIDETVQNIHYEADYYLRPADFIDNSDTFGLFANEADP